MDEQRYREEKYLLHKMIVMDGEDFLSGNLWFWEVDRWKELVFALLTQIVSLPEDKIRELVDSLLRLDLLDIHYLAKIDLESNYLQANSTYASHILEFLEENGISQSEAEESLTTVCEAAIGLQEHYDGKVQRYLRQYGEMILQEVETIFKFSHLNKAAIRQAFTYWLQNVLNMPLSLFDENIQQFCEKNQLKPHQLFEAADELNINFALVDDLVELHNAKEVKDNFDLLIEKEEI